MTIGAYKKQVHNDLGSGLVPSGIPAKSKFELKGHILGMLKDIPFSEKDYEDAFNHIEEIKDIANYFNVPGVSREAVSLRMLPVTFTGDAKIWLKSLAPGAITTWKNLHESFIEQFSPPSKNIKAQEEESKFLTIRW